MNISGITSEGKYYDGQSPVAHPASLVFSGSEAVLTSCGSTHVYPAHELNISPRTGSADRFISLPDGGQFQCADQPFLDGLSHEVRAEGIVAWLEARVSVAVVSIAVIICALVLGYFYGLPAAAESVVKRIPVETEAALGEQVLEWFDDKHWFNKSNIEQERQDAITDNFNRLHEGLLMSPYMRLTFRDSEFIGPNAFALPGGTIVITDQMIEKAGSDEEILAVLAHEIGHVELRHSMRQILQSSSIALIAAAVTGDAASLSGAVAGLPVLLAQTKYSREFEIEADDYAYVLLRSNDIPIDAFVNIMEKLDKDDSYMRRWSWMSTHPMTSERIKRAKARSSQ